MSETENESTPRFNKAIIGRIVAVVIFVALGTFAVIQSMKTKSEGPTVSPETELSSTPDGDAPQTNVNDTDAPPTDITKSAGNENTKLASVNPNQPNAFPKPPVSPSQSESSRGNEFATSPASKLAGRNTDVASSKTMPGSKTTPANTSFQVGQPKLPVVAQTQKKPPERFAQAPGGLPIIGSKGGFGTRPIGPDVPSTKIESAAINRLLPTDEKKPAAIRQLQEGAKESASDFLQQTSQKAAAAAKSLQENANSFATSPNPGSQLPGPPPAKSFVPPSGQSDIAKQNSFPSNPAANPAKKPDSSSIISSRNLAPVTPAPTTPATPPAGFDATALKPVAPGITSRQSPSNPPKSNGATSSPFGDLNVTSSSRTTEQSAPLRTPPPPVRGNPAPSAQSPFAANQQPTVSRTTFPANQQSTGSSSTFPSNNNRPTSRLGTNSPVASTPPAELAQATPGDRQLEGVQAAALTIEKLSPSEIQVDQPADFQLVVKNVGRAAAEDVRVFDRIPTGTEFLGASPEPANPPRGGDIQWNIGQLRPGQEKRIKIQLKPTRPGEIGSVAHVTFSTQASMRTLVTKPVLEIVHQSQPTHLIGDDVILDVVVKNKGDGPAKNVLIQEDVPKQLEFQDGYRELEYEIGTLMPGQSRRVKLALKAAQVGKLRNVMFASAEGGLQTKHELPMEVIAPKLAVSTDGPTRRFLQRTVSHQFSVANNGTAPATNVELIARLPSGLRFQTANNQGRYDANAHAVYWSLAELARGVEAKVELKTMPVEVGNQPIKFESFADLNVKANAEQALSVEHLVDVFFDIDDVVDPIEIGSNTSYRIRIVNQGTKAATNVALQVDFPPGLQPISVDGSLRHNINGQKIAFEPINSLTPGAEISVVIHGKGQSAGDHRVVVNMRADGRQTPVSKEETTRVYSDR